MSGSVETPVYRFAVLGAGWRTLFYLRVVAALDKCFQLTGVVGGKARCSERHAPGAEA